MQQRSLLPWLVVVLAGCLCATASTGTVIMPAASATDFAAPSTPGQVNTIPDWRMQSSEVARVAGSLVSSPSYADTGWYPVPARSTVMAGLIANDRYPDLNYSTTLRDSVHEKDFAVPWWYRRVFDAEPEPGVHTFLRFDGGIISRGEVWLNGTRIASTAEMVGAYPAHEFDITELLRSGQNAVAVKAVPGSPERDLTLTFADWAPSAPDNNTGIWRDVALLANGAVSLRGARVLTSLAVPGLAHADLTVKAELRNNTDQSVGTTLSGTIGAISFSQDLTLAAHETRTVRFSPAEVPALGVDRPRVWWPAQLGEAALYQLSLAANVNGELSDSTVLDFGIRDVRSQLTPQGYRQFLVNGIPLLIRGAGWAPDLFLRTDPKRLADQLRYVHDLGLNTIRMEGKEENSEIYELADRMGIMLMPGWECCSKWEDWDTWTDTDYAVASASAATEGTRLRNHPSVLGFFIGSDNAPPRRVERTYLDALEKAELRVPIVPSAADKSTEMVGPSGTKMDGPYWWIPPNYWYGKQRGGAFGFASEVSSGPMIPELDTLRRYLSPAELDDLWKRPDTEQYHLSLRDIFSKPSTFSTAINKRYGPSWNLEDYVRKAQLANYESNRAQFEAYGRQMSDTNNPATGVIYWMLSNAWPTMYWHLFDHSLAPAGSYYGARTALRPLHVQYSYDDNSVVLVNTTRADVGGLSVRTTVFGLDGAEVSNQTAGGLTARGNTAQRVASAPAPAAAGTYFVRLLLSNARGEVVDRNVYWLSTTPDIVDYNNSNWYQTPVSQYADLAGLRNLPRSEVSATTSSEQTDGDTGVTTVTLTNTAGNGALAFFVRASLHASGGELVLPVTWSDNYVSLWPGETVTLRAEYRSSDLGGAAPSIDISGWNIPFQRIRTS